MSAGTGPPALGTDQTAATADERPAPPATGAQPIADQHGIDPTQGSTAAAAQAPAEAPMAAQQPAGTHNPSQASTSAAAPAPAPAPAAAPADTSHTAPAPPAATQPPQPQRVLVWKGFWSSKDCRARRDHLFIYGDNDQRKGVGGQAIIRNEPNAMGISTKKQPNSKPAAYWKDAELESNTTKIQVDITAILSRLQSGPYTTLVIPAKGFGTGLSKLPSKAPKTYQRLKSAVDRMLEDLQEGSSTQMQWR